MSVSSIRYLIHEGFRSVWHNGLMAVASIGVLMSCLFLTGGAYLIFANLNNAFDWLYSQNVVAVFADADCQTHEVLDIQLALEQLDNVSHVELITREEMLKDHAGDIPEELYESLQGEDNPMPDTFLVTVKDLEQCENTVAHIRTLDKVESINYNGDLAKQLADIRSAVFSICGWIVVLLLVVSLFIISNTIKLTVYNRRLEVRIMKSVGATNTFIRVPFMVEGMLLGLLAAGVAYGLLYYVYGRLSEMFTFGMMGSAEPFTAHATILSIGFVVVGVLIGMLGSAISVSRYLKEEVVHIDE